MSRLFRFLLTLPIRLYQWIISPLLPSTCNYYPTCSEYSRQAIVKHGILKGLLMSSMRIGRCSARYYGGTDPVPDVFDFHDLKREYRKRSVKRHSQGEHDE